MAWATTYSGDLGSNLLGIVSTNYTLETFLNLLPNNIANNPGLIISILNRSNPEYIGVECSTSNIADKSLEPRFNHIISIEKFIFFIHIFNWNSAIVIVRNVYNNIEVIIIALPIWGL